MCIIHCKTAISGRHPSVVNVGCQSAVYLSCQYAATFIYSGADCETSQVVSAKLSLSDDSNTEVSC